MDSSQIVTVPHKSFAAALGGNSSSPSDDALFLVPCIKGDALCIRIGHKEYTKGLAECQTALWGWLTLNKGDKPYTTKDLAVKLGKLWKMVNKWKMVSLGRDYYDFLSEHVDLHRVWTAGTIALNMGLLRLSQWTLIIILISKLMPPFGLDFLNCHKSIGGNGL